MAVVVVTSSYATRVPHPGQDSSWDFLGVASHSGQCSTLQLWRFVFDWCQLTHSLHCSLVQLTDSFDSLHELTATQLFQHSFYSLLWPWPSGWSQVDLKALNPRWCPPCLWHGTLGAICGVGRNRCMHTIAASIFKITHLDRSQIGND